MQGGADGERRVPFTLRLFLFLSLSFILSFGGRERRREACVRACACNQLSIAPHCHLRRQSGERVSSPPRPSVRVAWRQSQWVWVGGRRPSGIFSRTERTLLNHPRMVATINERGKSEVRMYMFVWRRFPGCRALKGFPGDDDDATATVNGLLARSK